MRRLEEERRVRSERAEVSQKFESWNFAKGYIADLIPNVFQNLKQSGYFYDRMEKDIENDFLPWLDMNVDRNFGNWQLARDLLDGITNLLNLGILYASVNS
jgi:hypothetical protein